MARGGRRPRSLPAGPAESGAERGVLSAVLSCAVLSRAVCGLLSRSRLKASR